MIRQRSPMVLLVEDDDDLRETFREVLSSAGYRVALACDGEEALELLGQLQPALVLLDLTMPRMSGHELLAHLREEPSLISIPVCVLSALPDDDTRGARCVLGKPVSVELLLDVVETYTMGRARLSDEAG